MRKFICIIVVVLSIISCKKKDSQHDGILSDAQRAYYLDYWKGELLQRDSMSIGYFNAHISGISGTTSRWNSGVMYRVSYQVTIDWAVIDYYDEFVIDLSSAESGYQYLNIPRDSFLQAPELQKMLDYSICGSVIGPVKSVNSLKYASYGLAVAALKDSANSVYFNQEWLTSAPYGSTSRDGFPYLRCSGTINSNQNKCIIGSINLATGQTSVETTPCLIE